MFILLANCSISCLSAYCVYDCLRIWLSACLRCIWLSACLLCICICLLTRMLPKNVHSFVRYSVCHYLSKPSTILSATTYLQYTPFTHSVLSATFHLSYPQFSLPLSTVSIPLLTFCLPLFICPSPIILPLSIQCITFYNSYLSIPHLSLPTPFPILAALLPLFCHCLSTLSPCYVCPALSI